VNGMDMPERLKKRVYLFYAAGVVNLLIGAYILLFGRGFIPEDKFTILILFFLGFAALDFWMPVMMKKKWAEEVRKHEEQRNTQGDQTTPRT